MIPTRCASGLFGLVLAAGSTGAQPTAPPTPSRPPEVVRVGVDFVQVDAIVTDKDGRHVTDLKAADFDVFENGKRQSLVDCTFVSLAAPAKDETGAPGVPGAAAPTVPRAMVFVVDDYGLEQTNNIPRVRDAVLKFIESHAGPALRVAVVRTSPQADAVPVFTSDPAFVRAAVEKLAIAPRSRMPSYAPAAMRINWHRRLMEQTLSGIRVAVDSLARMPGRRSLVLFSDRLSIRDPDPVSNSTDAEVMDSLAQIQERANRASVVIYTVPPMGLDAVVKRAWMDPFNGLHVLPEATGGLLLKNINDVASALDKVVADQSGYYLLGYTPAEPFRHREDGKPDFRALKVKVKRKGLEVRSRKGFVGVPTVDEPPVSMASAQPLATVATWPVAAMELDVQMTNRPTSTAGAVGVHSTIRIAPQWLTLRATEGGGRTVSVDLLAVALGADGIIVKQVRPLTERTLKGQDASRLETDGVAFEFDIPLPEPGMYQVKVVVEDVASGRIGSAIEAVSVPAGEAR